MVEKMLQTHPRLKERNERKISYLEPFYLVLISLRMS